MTTYSNFKKGFTLIELLMVIAVIGLLTSIILTSLANAKAKARDARRISDMHQLQTALELYINKNGSYPIGTGPVAPPANQLAALVTGGFITSMPIDPAGDINSYLYFSPIPLNYPCGGVVDPTWRYVLQFHSETTLNQRSNGTANYYCFPAP